MLHSHGSETASSCDFLLRQSCLFTKELNLNDNGRLIFKAYHSDVDV